MSQTFKGEIELDPIKNVKLIHFKDELGRPMDGQLVIGEVEEVRKQNFERPLEVEAKRNLGKFKQALAYLGVIKSTKKITITEIYREDVVSKKQEVIGVHELGNFSKERDVVDGFIAELQEWGSTAHDIKGNEIGYINNEGNLQRNKNTQINYDETILQQNGKVVAIEKNGKFLDLEGNDLQNQSQFIHKDNKIYTLDNSNKNVKQTTEISLKGSEEATKIGEELRKKQEQNNFAGINKPRGAKLTKVAAPRVPTR